MFFITSNKGRITLDLEALNTRTQAAWNQNAEFWDEKMGEGNQFQDAGVRVFSWTNFKDIPPVLVVRMRLL
jgi:hypothetical protein